jgi:hypothetical protein
LRNVPPVSVLVVILLFGLAITYFIWPYLVAFLAILGGLQMLRIWQRNNSDRNSRR